MAKWYFTFGYNDGGGWAEVSADDMEKAVSIFNLYHPMRDGRVACCAWYSADQFEKTNMFLNGNYGKRAVEHIILNQFDFKGATVRDSNA